MSRPKRRRPYDASGRQRRASARREQILETARRLFAERGYAQTTLEQIARGAGVALPTVYAAFRSKRGLLDALMKRVVAGEAGGPPLLETAGPRAIAAERDPVREVALFVDHLMTVQDRAIPMYEVLKDAARADAEVATLHTQLQQYRYGNLKSLASQLHRLKALREGIDVDEAAWTLWAITSPEVRRMLQAHAGWSAETYGRWLERALGGALLATQDHVNRR
jgi:AcrR family transcriptional regulator